MRSRLHRFIDIAVCGLVLFLMAGLLSAGASAAVLAAGGSIAPDGEAFPTGGTVAATTGAVPIVTATFTGTLTSTVIQNDPSNPFSGLTFTYLIQNGLGSTDPIERLTVSSFTGFNTDVSYQTPTTAFIGTAYTRTANGNVVGFNFDSTQGITPGSSSALLVIQTNAGTYQTSSASVIDGSVGTATSFAPLTLIPEPATLGLLACGGVLAFRRR